MIFLDISKPIEVNDLFVSLNRSIHTILVIEYLDFVYSIGSIESIS